MIPLSRSFVRKRMIALATTATVAATSFAVAGDPPKSDHPRGVMPIQYAADWADHSEEQPFLSENDAAMNKMMADMVIKPTGNVDHDFVAMMAPHHRGAVDMANAELKYGHNEQLLRLAREIVAKQQQEIKLMRDAVSDERLFRGQSPKQPRVELSPQSDSADDARSPVSQ